jgi:hypothetical protein
MPDKVDLDAISQALRHIPIINVITRWPDASVLRCQLGPTVEFGINENGYMWTDTDDRPMHPLTPEGKQAFDIIWEYANADAGTDS